MIDGLYEENNIERRLLLEFGQRQKYNGGGYIIFHVADYFLSLFYFRPQLFRRQLIPAAFIFGQAQKQRKYFYYRRRALNDYYFQRRILFLFFWPLFGRRYYSAANRKIIVHHICGSRKLIFSFVLCCWQVGIASY